MLVNNKRICKNRCHNDKYFYNGKYYNNAIAIIRRNCNGIFYIKNYTIDIKVTYQNIYRRVHKVQVRDDDGFIYYVMEPLEHLKLYLDKNKKYIIDKNKKYYKIYFLINPEKYNQKIKIIYKYGARTLSVKRDYNIQ